MNTPLTSRTHLTLDNDVEHITIAPAMHLEGGR